MIKTKIPLMRTHHISHLHLWFETHFVSSFSSLFTTNKRWNKNLFIIELDTIAFMFETQYRSSIYFSRSLEKFFRMFCAKFKMNIHLKILIELALSSLSQVNFVLNRIKLNVSCKHDNKQLTFRRHLKIS